MVCKVSRTTLFQYLDGEMPAEEVARLEAHLAACSDCDRLVSSERAFRSAYLDRLRPDPTPPDVRQRVTQLLHALTARQPAPRRRPRPRQATTPAAVLLLAAGILVGLLVFRSPDPVVALADASVDQHQKLARGVLPFDIATASTGEAEEWFRRRLDFNVSIPELRNEHLAFLGGRISHLRDFEVAALAYRVNDTNVSLFIIPDEQYRRLGLSDTPKFKIVNRRGYDVIVWRSHGTGYSLVSEIGGKSCLVCHAPEDRLDLTPAAAAHRS
jgi:anti-sigma factor (TIGR02949 family)